MNTKRFIFILVVISTMHSCRNATITEDRQAPQQSVTEKYIPDWSPPEINSSWIYLPLDRANESAITVHDQVETQISVRRDTIKGIVVREAGPIAIEERIIEIEERKNDEEAFYAISYISTNKYVSVVFDNDIFNNTDYYYTNGIRIEYVSPVFASSPLAYPMLPYRKYSINYHGMAVIQNMYTPTNPDTINIIEGDRPFAAYLCLGHNKNTLSQGRKYRQYSELIIGLIGPGSLGGFVQGQIHDIPPMGWENQVQNDLVLNYTVIIEKGLFNKQPVDLNIFAEGQLGTLYDNAGGGIRFRLGKLNPYFSVPMLAHPESVEGEGRLKWQYGIFSTVKLKFVAYDATLQGGMFNKSSKYTIPGSDIERFVLQASAGIFIAYNQFGLIYEQFYLSPEFENAHHFRWGHINLRYCF